MLKTSIILEMDGKFPVWHKSSGFAKSLLIAKWLFEYCGWRQGKPTSELCYQVERIDWAEGDRYFPCNMTELWVLGSCLQLN